MNYFLKGMSSSKEELEQIIQQFKRVNMPLEILFDEYKDLSGITPEDIEKEIDKRIDKTSRINLICHSLGCNLGVIYAARKQHDSNVKKLILVSPEIVQTSLLERSKIKKAYRGEPEILEPDSKSLKEKLELLRLYMQTAKQAQKDIQRLIKMEQSILVLNSVGDPYVSQEYLKKSFDRADKILVKTLDSPNHNPLLKNDDNCVGQIYEYCK